MRDRPLRNPRRWFFVALVVLVLLAAAWLLNVSRPGTRPTGCADGCATAGPRRDGPLRVLSLNVLHGFPRFERLDERLHLIVAEIRRQDADLVFLQEVPWHRGSAAGYLAEQTGLNHLYLRANGSRWALLFEEGEALLSRYPLRDPVSVELKPRAGFFEHRVVLGATAVTPWGDLRLYVTHLTHGEPAINQAQAADLAAFVQRSAGGPALVAGDFNATEDSPQIQALGWIDTYRTAHPHDLGLTCCVDDLSAGPGERLEKRIDYLFLVPAGVAVANEEDGTSIEVVDSQRVLDRPARTGDGWLWASDHVGLLTTLSLEP